MSEVQTRDNAEANRYEAWIGEKLAGFAEYRSSPGVIDFVHTEVDDAFEGEGIGSSLVRDALDDVRRRGRPGGDFEGGLRVRASCPFVKEWIERHEDYQDLAA